MQYKPLSRHFYENDTSVVAQRLLGKILIRKFRKQLLAGKIVETEAYYGEKDPASRAYSGRPKFCVKLMREKPGKALIYVVHGNPLFNIVAHEKGKVGAVLIRAIEPLKGIKLMKKNRGLNDLRKLTNGPGKLSRALRITKKLNGIYVTRRSSPIIIVDNKTSIEIGRSKRIGVTRDLKQELRFFVRGNPFVSK